MKTWLMFYKQPLPIWSRPLRENIQSCYACITISGSDYSSSVSPRQRQCHNRSPRVRKKRIWKMTFSFQEVNRVSTSKWIEFIYRGKFCWFSQWICNLLNSCANKWAQGSICNKTADVICGVDIGHWWQYRIHIFFILCLLTFSNIWIQKSYFYFILLFLWCIRFTGSCNNVHGLGICNPQDARLLKYTFIFTY